jgi:hypothetical protein
MEATLQRDSAMIEDFAEYYASSRYGQTDELLGVHSIINIWFRYLSYQSYQNHITNSRLDKLLGMLLIFYSGYERLPTTSTITHSPATQRA